VLLASLVLGEAFDGCHEFLIEEIDVCAVGAAVGRVVLVSNHGQFHGKFLGSCQSGFHDLSVTACVLVRTEDGYRI